MEWWQLNDSVDSLTELVERGEAGERVWGDFWTKVKEIGTEFRNVRYPTRDERNAAWERFQGVVGRAKAQKERVDAERTEKRLAWEQRTFNSSTHRNIVKDAILGAAPHWGTTMLDELADGLIGLSRYEQRKVQRERLQRYNDGMKEAWDTFNRYKEHMTREDKQACWDDLQEAQRTLSEAWDYFKRQ